MLYLILSIICSVSVGILLKIAKKYAIYQWYWTAWSNDNSLEFRDDIYNLDADLYAKLRN